MELEVVIVVGLPTECGVCKMFEEVGSDREEGVHASTLTQLTPEKYLRAISFATSTSSVRTRPPGLRCALRSTPSSTSTNSSSARTQAFGMVNLLLSLS